MFSCYLYTYRKELQTLQIRVYLKNVPIGMQGTIQNPKLLDELQDYSICPDALIHFQYNARRYDRCINFCKLPIDIREKT